MALLEEWVNLEGDLENEKQKSQEILMSWMNYMGLALFSCVMLSARADAPHLNFAPRESIRSCSGGLFQQMQKMRLLAKPQDGGEYPRGEYEETYKGKSYRVRWISNWEIAVYNLEDEVLAVDDLPFATLEISGNQPRLSDLQPTPGVSRQEAIDLCLQIIKKHCPDCHYAYACDLDLNFDQLSCDNCSLVEYRLMSAMLEGTTPHLASGGKPVIQEKLTLAFDGTSSDAVEINEGYKSAVHFLYHLPVNQLAGDFEQLPWSDIAQMASELKRLCEESGLDSYRATMGELAKQLHEQSSLSKAGHKRWHQFVKNFVLFQNSYLARITSWIGRMENGELEPLELALRRTFLHELRNYEEIPSQIFNWSRDILDCESSLSLELKEEWQALLEESRWLSRKHQLFSETKRAFRLPPSLLQAKLDRISHSKALRPSEEVFDLHAKFLTLLSKSYKGHLAENAKLFKTHRLESINALVRRKTALERSRQMGHFYVEAVKRTRDEFSDEFSKFEADLGAKDFESVEGMLSQLIQSGKKRPESMPVGYTAALWLLCKIAVQNQTTFLYEVR